MSEKKNLVKPNVISGNGSELRLISEETEQKLDTCYQNLKKFMDDNSGKGKSDEEKDTLYAEARDLWATFSTALNDARFNIILKKSEVDYAFKVLSTDIEYNYNTVLLAEDIIMLFAGESTESVEFSASQVTIFYHLLAEHKVSGFGDDARKFKNILISIGETSKVFNYYNTLLESMSTEVQDWVVLFEDGVYAE